MLPSRGSLAHGTLDKDGQPVCQPCAWFYKDSGCLNAAPCKYCHLCPQGELKNRKKKKIARLRSEENMVQEPAYVRVPDLDMRRSKAVVPAAAAKVEAEDREDSCQAATMAPVGLVQPPGLDAVPPSGLEQETGLQMDYGPLFNAWVSPEWLLDPGGAFAGYEPHLSLPMAFPPSPTGPLDSQPLGMQQTTSGLLLPQLPGKPPSIYEGGALRAGAGGDPQASLWAAEAAADPLVGNFHMPRGMLPTPPQVVDLPMSQGFLPTERQAGLSLEHLAFSLPDPLWEVRQEAPTMDHAPVGGLAAEWTLGATPDIPACDLSRALSADLEVTAEAGGEQPELERAAAQASVRTEQGLGGTFCVSWTVDARKLKASDKVAVSPAFQVPTARGNFRMMLLPKVVDDRKGGASFKRAKGKGLVQVKCEENLEDPCGGTVALRLSVHSGGAETDCLERAALPRGPVKHDFAERGIFGLPKEQEEWDFGKIVNGSQTFTVCLEILPPFLADISTTGAPPGLVWEGLGPAVGEVQ